MFNWINTAWDSTKAFFNRSWSILLARLEILSGFILGVVAAIDWTDLGNIDFNAGFSNNQITWMAIGLVIKGIVSEIGRRAGTVTTAVTNQLVAVDVAQKADLEVKK